jgi:hypothetical protein
MACELANAAGAKRLALFHHDPGYDDESIHDLEEQAQTDFKASFAAREGQVIELGIEKRPGLSAEKRSSEKASSSRLASTTA